MSSLLSTKVCVFMRTLERVFKNTLAGIFSRASPCSLPWHTETPPGAALPLAQVSPTAELPLGEVSAGAEPRAEPGPVVVQAALTSVGSYQRG